MANPFAPLKRAIYFAATLCGLYLIAFVHPVVAGDKSSIPLFRNGAGPVLTATEQVKSPLRILADADFPPFSYANDSGQAVGLSVDLALFACSEIKVTCSVMLKPFNQLLPSLLRNEGDVIVSGMKIDETLMASTTMTRPYFWSFGRFMVPRASKIETSEASALEDKTLGYVKDTAHGAWLEKYYSDAELTPFSTEREMLAALKSQKVEAAFGDNLHLIYWLDGSASNGCCKTLGGAYVDREFFSRNLAFVLRRDSDATRKALDQALDRLQGKGTSSELLARYLPPGFW
jgi:polar amino acid transport system substrate-binding protein